MRFTFFHFSIPLNKFLKLSIHRELFSYIYVQSSYLDSFLSHTDLRSGTVLRGNPPKFISKTDCVLALPVSSPDRTLVTPENYFHSKQNHSLKLSRLASKSRKQNCYASVLSRLPHPLSLCLFLLLFLTDLTFIYLKGLWFLKVSLEHPLVEN